MVKDIILKDDYDLLVENGDFVVDNSDPQHVQLIIITAQGEWKEHVLLGVGIESFINAPSSLQELSRLINIQLISDNYTVTKLNVISPTNIMVDGQRNEFTNGN